MNKQLLKELFHKFLFEINNYSEVKIREYFNKHSMEEIIQDFNKWLRKHNININVTLQDIINMYVEKEEVKKQRQVKLMTFNEFIKYVKQIDINELEKKQKEVTEKYRKLDIEKILRKD